MDDLVDRTGFSKRQIRYYITEKLVPGAGNQRGPNAVYGEVTLQRLEMIKILKVQTINHKQRPVAKPPWVGFLRETRVTPSAPYSAQI